MNGKADTGGTTASQMKPFSKPTEPGRSLLANTSGILAANSGQSWTASKLFGFNPTCVLAGKKEHVGNAIRHWGWAPLHSWLVLTIDQAFKRPERSLPNDDSDALGFFLEVFGLFWSNFWDAVSERSCWSFCMMIGMLFWEVFGLSWGTFWDAVSETSIEIGKAVGKPLGKPTENQYETKGKPVGKPKENQ